jgi:hypothetical protein
VTEPAASTANAIGASITGGAVVIFGPAFGPWASILFAAIIGSLWSVGVADTGDRLHASVLLARNVLTACVLTGAAGYAAMQYTTMPTEYLLPACAFAIAAWFDQLRASIVELIKQRLGGQRE